MDINGYWILMDIILGINHFLLLGANCPYK